MKVLVLREGVHGFDVESYAAGLRERLPDHEIVHARTRDAEVREIQDARIATGPNLDADLLESARRLRLFAGAYAGADHLPLDTLAERGIAVTNAAGVHAPNVAEHVIGSLLVFSRNFREGWRQEQNGEWRPYKIGELAGSTTTVVGLGNIGGAIVDRLAAFDVETVGIRGSPEKGGPADTVRGLDGFHDALAHSDHLVLACPLTPETRGLVGEAEFLTLPSHAVLVNVARGPVVDTDALVAALRGGQVGGASLDVTEPEPLPRDHPLWGFGNVQVTPHNAGATPNYYDRLADLVAENIERLEDGEVGDLTNLVTGAERD